VHTLERRNTVFTARNNSDNQSNNNSVVINNISNNELDLNLDLFENLIKKTEIQ
jgi:hypothetical protein